MKVSIGLILVITIATFLNLVLCEEKAHEGKKSSDSSDDEAKVEEHRSEDFHFKGGRHQHQGDHVAPEFLGPAPTLIEEVKFKIRSMFPAADHNHDDKLSEEEMSNWNNKQIRDFVHMNTKSQIRILDANGDGKVTWPEFLRGMYGDKEDRAKNKEVQKAIYKDRRRFDIADRNHDNELNFDELGMMLHPEEHNEMSDVFVEEMMEGVDTDGDGFISFDEYVGDLPKDSPNTKIMEDMFKGQLDENGDGRLDKHEMREWVFPEKKDLAALEAYHLFRSLDKNKDGFVTLEDLLANHEIVAGSKGMHYYSILQRHEPVMYHNRREEL